MTCSSVDLLRGLVTVAHILCLSSIYSPCLQSTWKDILFQPWCLCLLCKFSHLASLDQFYKMKENHVFIFPSLSLIPLIPLTTINNKGKYLSFIHWRANSSDGIFSSHGIISNGNHTDSLKRLLSCFNAALK